MSIVVLCPNGRRQTIKVTPNMSILEILENVCAKQCYDNREYTLCRNNKPLDLSLTVRFSNIPNNGQLELKPALNQRKEEPITVAIQTESGERKIGKFVSNQNIWDILTQLFGSNIIQDKEDLSVCVIYMRNELIGELSLKETTLRSLGLSSGNAVMRLLFRSKETLKTQAFEGTGIFNPQTKVDDWDSSDWNVPVNAEPTPDKEVAYSNVIPQTSFQSSHIEKSIEHTKPVVADVKEEDKENDIQCAKSEDIEKKENEISERMEIDLTQSQEDFNETIDETVDILGENSALFFSLNDIPKIRNEISDEFFNITKDDIVYLLNDLRRQQEGKADRPLETKEMRDKKEREKSNRYETSIVRVCFHSDNLVLQAIFKPFDTIDTVMQTVQKYLNDPQLPFYLFTSPPKTVLNPNMTLLECNLVPAALIYFGSSSSPSGNLVLKVLKDYIKDRISSYRGAANVTNEARKGKNSDASQRQNVNSEIPSHPIESTSAGSASTSAESASARAESASARSSHATNDDGSKIPKWFKMGK